jgi:hypothetical protein
MHLRTSRGPVDQRRARFETAGSWDGERGALAMFAEREIGGGRNWESRCMRHACMVLLEASSVLGLICRRQRDENGVARTRTENFSGEKLVWAKRPRGLSKL